MLGPESATAGCNGHTVALILPSASRAQKNFRARRLFCRNRHRKRPTHASQLRRAAGFNSRKRTMTDELTLVGEPERSLAITPAQTAPRITNNREAFAWALPASQAFPAKKIARLNVDIKLAPSIVIAARAKILPFRPELAALVGFDLTCLDTLEWHARATMYAETLYMTVSSGPKRVAELAKLARAWRSLLLQDMSVMVTRGLLLAEDQAKLKGQAGYQNLSYVLRALTQVYRAAWAKLYGETTIRERELDQAEQVADQLAIAFARRGDQHQVLKAANEQRQRNFTLLAYAYDHVRRGLSYLRWYEGDIEDIAPSLYRGRGGSRRKEKTQPQSETGSATNSLAMA
jgi:hypothetical protein